MNQELLKTLKLFKEQAEKLKSNQDFFKNLSWTLEYKQGQGVTTKFTARPDDKTIKAVLVDLRPFLLEGEPINFYRICNLLYQNCNSQQLKEKIKKTRDIWNILLERKGTSPVGGIRLRIGPKDILSEENLKNWLYGEYFHLEKDKRKVLEQMNLTPMGGLSFLLFLDLLQRLSALVFYLEKQVIDNILNKD